MCMVQEEEMTYKDAFKIVFFVMVWVNIVNVLVNYLPKWILLTDMPPWASMNYFVLSTLFVLFGVRLSLKWLSKYSKHKE